MVLHRATKKKETALQSELFSANYIQYSPPSKRQCKEK